MNQLASTDEREEMLNQWCAVVDSRTGKVVHIHQFFPVDESEMLSEEDLARQALEHMPEGPDRSRLEVVLPDRELMLELRTHYSLEKGTRRLVARPLKPRRGRSRRSSST